jgi:hypothetical protein
VAIPGESHKDVAHDQQQDRINTVCHNEAVSKTATKLHIFSQKPADSGKISQKA